MLKKIFTFALFTFYSFNASAGYVHYDLNYDSSHNGLSGFFIQHHDDQSIAYFSFWVNDINRNYGGMFHPYTDDSGIHLISATTYFQNNGPTNFTIHDSYGSDHDTRLSVTFSRTTQGSFKYTAHYVADLWANHPPEVRSGTVIGLATIGIVDPYLASELDRYHGYYEGVPRIIPEFVNLNRVPEPASLSLLALGAAALVGATRRRNSLGDSLFTMRSEETTLRITFRLRPTRSP